MPFYFFLFAILINNAFAADLPAHRGKSLDQIIGEFEERWEQEYRRAKRLKPRPIETYLAYIDRLQKTDPVKFGSDLNITQVRTYSNSEVESLITAYHKKLNGSKVENLEYRDQIIDITRPIREQLSFTPKYIYKIRDKEIKTLLQELDPSVKADDGVVTISEIDLLKIGYSVESSNLFDMLTEAEDLTFPPAKYRRYREAQRLMSDDFPNVYVRRSISPEEHGLAAVIQTKVKSLLTSLEESDFAGTHLGSELLPFDSHKEQFVTMWKSIEGSDLGGFVTSLTLLAHDLSKREAPRFMDIFSTAFVTKEFPSHGLLVDYAHTLVFRGRQECENRNICPMAVTTNFLSDSDESVDYLSEDEEN